ncbi:MAG: amidohydrolase [Gammaproteobacteria bacterium]|nr:amidohydrolase [Gammaproteobacteria bacterium]
MSERPYLRIATEEAFCPPDLFDRYRRIIADGSLDDPGFVTQWRYYLESDSARAAFVREALVDLESRRLADMDAAGIDQAIIALTSPGVQVMERADAVAYARYANDVLADAVRAHPDRYHGLTAVAPQDPEAAAAEVERGHELGFKGVIVHSHTTNAYMSDPKYWPILEACEALGTPLYMHPNTPSKGMAGPLIESGLDGAIWGFAIETASHLLKILVAGALDRFPGLKIAVGHCGEAIPFWLYRLDHMHGAIVRANRYPNVKPLERKISEYVRENFWITTSGMPWPPAIEFCQRVLGVDRVLYAMDYPYQYVPEEVPMTESIDASPEVLRMLFQTNAEALFGL